MAGTAQLVPTHGLASGHSGPVGAGLSDMSGHGADARWCLEHRAPDRAAQGWRPGDSGSWITQSCQTAARSLNLRAPGWDLSGR